MKTQLENFCEFEHKANPGQTRIAQWALGEIERLTTALNKYSEDELLQTDKATIDRLTAELARISAINFSIAAGDMAAKHKMERDSYRVINWKLLEDIDRVATERDVIRTNAIETQAWADSVQAQGQIVFTENKTLRLAAQAGIAAMARCIRLVFIAGTPLDKALKAAITQLEAALKGTV